MTKENKQKHCIQCGSLISETDKFCGACGAENITKKQNEKISTSGDIQEDLSLGLGWFNFYKNILILFLGSLIVLFCLVSAITDEDSSILLFAFILAILVGTQFYGLHKRKLWGWYLVMLYFYLVLLTALISLLDADLAMFLGKIIWVVPNLIYFNRRKYLFN